LTGKRFSLKGIVIRNAFKSDLESILGLYSEPEMDDGRVVDLSKAERIFERMKLYPNYAIYVAELEDEIIGTFSLLIMDNLAHMGAPSGIVEDVVVRSHWQRHGVGKRMMDFAMKQSEKAGCYKLMLSSNLKRKLAHNFYESLGFQRHGYSYIAKFKE
jgi:GNAT superfamily N-acetyltransferase